VALGRLQLMQHPLNPTGARLSAIQSGWWGIEVPSIPRALVVGGGPRLRPPGQAPSSLGWGGQRALPLARAPCQMSRSPNARKTACLPACQDPAIPQRNPPNTPNCPSPSPQQHQHRAARPDRPTAPSLRLGASSHFLHPAALESHAAVAPAGSHVVGPTEPAAGRRAAPQLCPHPVHGIHGAPHPSPVKTRSPTSLRTAR